MNKDKINMFLFMTASESLKFKLKLLINSLGLFEGYKKAHNCTRNKIELNSIIQK